MQLPKPGDTLLGKYVLEHSLGVGGMGVVFAARHDLLGQRVAVKLIKPEFAIRQDAVNRFLNEARAAARIHNEHVARVIDVGRLESGLPYMVLDYLDGADLGRILYERGRLPISDVCDYVLQAVEALAQAHTLGIVHRDLKPSNLFLARRQDGSVTVKVFDFGISKILGESSDPASMTKTNAILGSPLYMSPEQLRDSKNVDHRSDIWSIGVVAYELLTGRPPFIADNAVALFAAIQESEPDPVRSMRPDVSPELDAAILRCLKRKRDERFGSVTELGFALAPFGTILASRAYENTSRILPLGDHPAVSNLASTTNPNESRAPEPSDARSVTAAMPPGMVQTPMPQTPMPGPQTPMPAPNAPVRLTGDAVSTAASPVAPSTRPMLLVGAVAVVVALGIGIGIVMAKGKTPPVTAVSASTSASVAPPPPIASPSAVAVEPPVVPVPPSASASASASVTPPPPPTTPRQPPPPPTAMVKTAEPPPKASASAPPVVRPNCNPPYDFDASGKKIWKKDCL